MSTKFEMFDLLAERLLELHKERIALGKDALKELVGEIFKLGTVKMIYWNQYAPYFNDGEECVFNVNDIEYSSHVIDCSPEHFDDEDAEFAEEFHVGAPHYRAANAYFGTESTILLEKLNSFVCKNGDLMRELFGDHVEVFITESGIETSSYDHE